MIVLDASAALEVLLDTPAGRLIDARLSEHADEPHVPHLIDIEITNALRRFAAMGKLTAAHCLTKLNEWREVPLARYRHQDLLPRVWELRDNLSPYDAIYVALAETLGAPLVTHDRRLSNAPGHDATIELI